MIPNVDAYINLSNIALFLFTISIIFYILSLVFSKNTNTPKMFLISAILSFSPSMMIPVLLNYGQRFSGNTIFAIFVKFGAIILSISFFLLIANIVIFAFSYSDKKESNNIISKITNWLLYFASLECFIYGILSYLSPYC